MAQSRVPWLRGISDNKDKRNKALHMWNYDPETDNSEYMTVINFSQKDSKADFSAAEVFGFFSRSFLTKLVGN